MNPGGLRLGGGVKPGRTAWLPSTRGGPGAPEGGTEAEPEEVTIPEGGRQERVIIEDDLNASGPFRLTMQALHVLSIVEMADTLYCRLRMCGTESLSSLAARSLATLGSPLSLGPSPYPEPALNPLALAGALPPK